MRRNEHRTRNCVFTLALALLASSPVLAEEASVMVLEGTTAAPYDNGDFTVFDPARTWDQTRLEQWKETAKPDERPPLEAQGVIAQASIGPDARFRVEIPLDRPRTAFFAVLNAKAPGGATWGPVKMGTTSRAKRLMARSCARPTYEATVATCWWSSGLPGAVPAEWRFRT